MQKSQVAR